MSLREVGSVRGDLVRDDAFAHVVAVGQAEVLFRRDVTEKGRAVPADHRGPDRRRDVVVPGRDVGRQRTERVEGRLAAPLQLEVHVLFDLVHRHMARPFDHDLHVVPPRDLGELPQRAQLRQLRFVVPVGDGPRSQPIAERERDIVRAHDLAQLLEVRV